MHISDPSAVCPHVRLSVSPSTRRMRQMGFDRDINPVSSHIKCASGVEHLHIVDFHFIDVDSLRKKIKILPAIKVPLQKQIKCVHVTLFRDYDARSRVD